MSTTKARAHWRHEPRCTFLPALRPATIGWIPLAALAVVALPVSAQAPAARSGESRTAVAHPNLGGTWDNGGGVAFILPQRDGDSICLRNCPPPPAEAATQTASTPRPPPRAPSRPNYRPEFAAKVADLTERQVEEDPALRCNSPGVPRIGLPDKIVQGQDEIVFLYEDLSGNFFRIIPTDGRPHRPDTEPTHLGDAVGHWEGDTLVVETVHFNEETWLTDDGAFHTENLRVVERLSRTADTLHWSATVYDPEVLSEPWVVDPRTATLTKRELIEVPRCIDQDLDHIVDGSFHPNRR